MHLPVSTAERFRADYIFLLIFASYYIRLCKNPLENEERAHFVEKTVKK